MSNPDFQVIVSNSLKEKDFYRALIGAITELSTNITCDKDPDEEFDISTKGDSYIPEFTFKVNNVEFFKITRSSNLSTATNAFNLSVNTNVEVIGNTSQSITFINGSQSIDAEKQRMCYLSYIVSSNEKLIGINIKSYLSNVSLTMLFSISSSQTHKAAKNDENLISSFNFTDYNLWNTESPYVGGRFRSRFSYSAPVGNIDYIKSSTYTEIYKGNQDIWYPVTGDGAAKRFDITSMFDCTTVTPGSTVSLKDGNYYAVGTNQLVKIS